MPANEIISFYGKSGKFEEFKYTIKFISRFLLEKLAFFAPISPIRVLLHKIRGVKIGQGVYIGHEVIIDRLYPDQVILEDNCSIGDRTTLYAHANIPSNTRLKKIYPRNVKPIRVGKGVWIMPGCIVILGVTIGEEAVVATGSIVTKDVPSKTLVGGSPAKVLKDLSEHRVFNNEENSKSVKGILSENIN